MKIEVLSLKKGIKIIHIISISSALLGPTPILSPDAIVYVLLLAFHRVFKPMVTTDFWAAPCASIVKVLLPLLIFRIPMGP